MKAGGDSSRPLREGGLHSAVVRMAFRTRSGPEPRVSGMRRAILLSQALALALAVVSCPSPAPVSPIAPSAVIPAAASAHARRAILVSIDGMAGERVVALLATPGALPAGGLARLVRDGFFAERSIPSTPSLTSTAHATHVTGALPRDTGIVGNSILDRTKPFGTKLSGFNAPLRADTLCESAHRQGKRVGVMAYPHGAGTPPTDCAGFGMNWVNDPLAAPRLVDLPANAWTPESGGSRRALLTFPPTAHQLPIIALASVPGGPFDRLRVVPEVGDPRIVRVGESFPVEVAGRSGRAGAWCRLLSLAPDLSRTEIYAGGLWETDAYPPEFRQEIDRRAGFWPGRADAKVFGPDSGRSEISIEQSDRLTEFLAVAGLAAEERSDWDLLLLYFSEVDVVEHHYLLVDPRQEHYSAERAARFAEYVDHAYRVADAVLVRIEKMLTARDALFVTADHGMTPLWTEIYPNEVLREHGFLRLAADGTVDPASAAVVLASSGIGHVYVNGAAPAGTLDAIEKIFRDLRLDGEYPWDRVVRRADAADLSLDAPESGDLILLAKPGFGVSPRTKSGIVSGLPDEYGGHGYRAAFPQLDATFLAAGPGVARGRVSEIPSQTIAARVAGALGIEPPRQAAPAR